MTREAWEEPRQTGRREEKACLFAGDKPTHGTVFSLSSSFSSTAFGSPRIGCEKPSGSPLLEYFTTLNAGGLDGPDSPDQSRPIPRDFNMNCLLIETRPRGTIRRYFGLSARDTCMTSALVTAAHIENRGTRASEIRSLKASIQLATYPLDQSACTLLASF